MRVIGTLQRVDVEGGAWVVVGDDGTRYQLLSDPHDLPSGARVEVDGDVEHDVMTLQMAGRPFRVDAIRRL